MKSRRRCCICFGLNRDTSIKQGQIAHLDGDATNSKEDNLAFFCFEHHDRYDSTSRQSKNFTREEVLQFRKELHDGIAIVFGSEVRFGEAKTVSPDPITGHYIREGSYESAELTVKRMPDGRYHVSGIALWGTSRELGPNIGELDFVGELHADAIEYRSTYDRSKPYRATLRFSGGRLTVSEQNWIGEFGMNVNFGGEYEKAI